MVTVRNRVAGPNVLVLTSEAAPAGKTRLSSACGATLPAQLAAVVQLLSGPRPVQMRVAKTIRSSSASAPSGAGCRPAARPAARRARREARGKSLATQSANGRDMGTSLSDQDDEEQVR